MSTHGVLTRFVRMPLALLAVALFGQGNVAQAPYSGFLEDYSELKPHPDKKRGQAMLYVKEGLDFSKYDKILLHRPLMYLHPESKATGVDPAEMAELADFFRQALLEALADYALVTPDEVGPGVLVVRVAINDVMPLNPAANIAGKLALKVVTLDLGGASIEGELLDGGSRERLAALIDSKKGKRFGLRSKGGSKTWGHTKGAFKAWAKNLQEALDGERYGQLKKSEEGSGITSN